jgi:hypothetical protein
MGDHRWEVRAVEKVTAFMKAVLLMHSPVFILFLFGWLISCVRIFVFVLWFYSVFGALIYDNNNKWEFI